MLDYGWEAEMIYSADIECCCKSTRLCVYSDTQPNNVTEGNFHLRYTPRAIGAMKSLLVASLLDFVRSVLLLIYILSSCSVRLS